jgi:hypothetical protein
VPEIAVYAGIAFLSATIGFFAGALMATSKIAYLENRISLNERPAPRPRESPEQPCTRFADVASSRTAARENKEPWRFSAGTGNFPQKRYILARAAWSRPCVAFHEDKAGHKGSTKKGSQTAC